MPICIEPKSRGVTVLLLIVEPKTKVGKIFPILLDNLLVSLPSKRIKVLIECLKMEIILDSYFIRIGLATVASVGIISTASASLDLLAGVEAGIETSTAMSTSDLAHTQTALSAQSIGESYSWQNNESGTRYEIIIDHQYSYGHYPCLAYDLVISTAQLTDTKSLDACQNSSGQWISITPSSSAL
jgi:surface antigen